MVYLRASKMVLSFKPVSPGRFEEAFVENVVPGRGDVGCPVMNFEFAPVRPAGYYHEQAKTLRDRSSKYFNTLAQGFWMVTEYDPCRELLQREDLFCSESFVASDPNPDYRLLPTHTDGEEHRKYRQIMAPWFSPNAIARLEPKMRNIARTIIEDLVDTGGDDVISRFCMRYPTQVFTALVGLTDEDAEITQPLVEDFFLGYSGEISQEQTTDSVNKLFAHYDGIIEDRKANPRDPSEDYFTALTQAKLDDRLLTHAEMQQMTFLLNIAGLDTARAHLGYLLLHLAQNPEDRQRILDEPTIIRNACEESLRYHAIIWILARKARKDMDFHGLPVRKGDMVAGILAAANRDPKKYDRPDEFVIDRRPPAHLEFAAGQHRCLGIHLARAELRVGIEEWHRLIPHYELAADASTLRERGSQLSLLSLPLKWSTNAVSI